MTGVLSKTAVLILAILINVMGVKFILTMYPAGLDEFGAMMLCLWVFCYPAQAYFLLKWITKGL